MAVTRKMLKAMGIEEEKIEQIIDAHTETVDALKEERDNYKADADMLKDVQQELDDLKKDGGDWQTKYEKEHSDFEAYKTAQTAKEIKIAKETAFKKLLKGLNVVEKRIDAITKITNLDELELDKDGKIKGEDDLKNTIKTEYADFIEQTSTVGTRTYTPPQDNGGTKTKEEIYKMENGRYVLSASERQAELAKLYRSEKGN